jgi:tetratricopeptide (TPR) repeat protein
LAVLRYKALTILWRAVAATGIHRAEAYFHLGNAHYAHNARPAAIVAWARAVSADPSHVKAWNNQANALLEDERLAAAAHAFSQLAALSEEPAPVWYMAGKCHYRLGDKASAKTAFTRCVENDAVHVGALEHLGRIALTERDAATAIAMLERAIAQADQPAVLHLCLGAARELSGDPAAARDCYALAISDATVRRQAEQRLRALAARAARPTKAPAGSEQHV